MTVPARLVAYALRSRLAPELCHGHAVYDRVDATIPAAVETVPHTFSRSFS